MSTHGGPPRSGRENWKIGCKVYVGNLSEGASKADIEGAFSKYGVLRNCWVARNPPGFAFVEFDDSRDAEDACRQLDGTRIAGGRIKAEMSHGRSRRGGSGGGGGGSGRGGPPSSFGRGPPPYPYGGIGRGGYAGGPRGGPYEPYGSSHHGGPRGSGYGSHHSGSGSGGYIDRAGRDRYPPPPRGSLGGKDYRHYSRSRSNSLGKSPPPPPRATARPRTPPSRSPSAERH